MAQEYIPDLLSRDMAETPAAGLMPEYAKDWLQGLTVDPSQMMYESLTNQMGGGQPLAQIAERSGAKNLGAFLHRTIDPGEFEFLDWLAKKGKQSEAATSVITPTYRSIFHPSEPLPGVVFSVKNPENIVGWAPEDVFSRSEMNDKIFNAMRRVNRQQAKLAPQPGLMPIDPEKYLKYVAAESKLKNMPWTKEWVPTRDYERGSDYPLNKLLSRQQKRLENLAREDPNMENSKFWELLNEVGYRMDPSEIVGVRVPRSYSPPRKISSKFTLSGVEQDFPEALAFAKRHNLPIWQFTPQTNPLEAAKGIGR